MEFDAHKETYEDNEVPHFGLNTPRKNQEVCTDPNKDSCQEIDVQEKEVADNNRDVTDPSCNYCPINLRKLSRVQEPGSKRRDGSVR